MLTSRFKLEQFTYYQARNYVYDVLHSINALQQPDDSEKLISKLNYTKLAIIQACAYIKKNNLTSSHYLILYDKAFQLLISKKLLYPDVSYAPLATTCYITLQHLQKISAITYDFLLHCAFLDPCPVPEQLIPYLFNEKDKNKSAQQAKEVKGIAQDYGFLTIDDQQQTISMHGLIQYAIKQQITQLPNFPYLKKNAQACRAIYPLYKERVADDDLVKRLRPHLETILAYLKATLYPITEPTIYKNMRTQITNLLADAYLFLGEYLNAQEMLSKIKLENMDAACKANVLTTFGIINGKLNAFDKQLDFLKQAFEVKKELYGLASVEAAEALDYVGRAYKALGKYKEANYALKEAHKIVTQCFEQHLYPTILINILNELGNIDILQGKYESSIKLLEKSLELEKRHYASNPIRLAEAYTRLGNAYVFLRNYQEVCTQLETALKIYIENYGLNHIRVSQTLMGLGCAYLSANKTSKALDIFEQALGINIMLYGKNHYEVKKVKWYIASAKKVSGLHRSQPTRKRMVDIAVLNPPVNVTANRQTLFTREPKTLSISLSDQAPTIQEQPQSKCRI